MDAVRDEISVMLVVDVVYSLTAHVEDDEAATLERAFFYRPDRFVDCMIDHFDHTGEDGSRRLEILVGVDSDRQFALFSCRLEDSEAGNACRMVDDIGTAFILTQRQFLSLLRVLEGVPGDSG